MNRFDLSRRSIARRALPYGDFLSRRGASPLYLGEGPAKWRSISKSRTYLRERESARAYNTWGARSGIPWERVPTYLYTPAFRRRMWTKKLSRLRESVSATL